MNEAAELQSKVANNNVGHHRTSATQRRHDDVNKRTTVKLDTMQKASRHSGSVRMCSYLLPVWSTRVQKTRDKRQNFSARGLFSQKGWILCSRALRMGFLFILTFALVSLLFNVYKVVISWFMEQMDNLWFTHLGWETWLLASYLDLVCWSKLAGNVLTEQQRWFNVCERLRLVPLQITLTVFIFIVWDLESGLGKFFLSLL